MAAGYLYRGGAQPGLGWKVVSRSDIGHLTPETLTPAMISRAPLIPYCFDFGGRTIIFSAAVDPKKAMAAEFHYDYLRSRSRCFVELPGQSIRLPQKASFPSSILLFSPGRCGSTLLAKVIRAMGNVCISEPDFYSQAAVYAAKSGGLRLDESRLLEIARKFLVSPWMQSTYPIVLKMRSHANHAPLQLLPEGQGPQKVLFLMRRFDPWCESRMRAFSNTLNDNIRLYKIALNALLKLQQGAECLLLDFDELNGESLSWAEGLAEFLGHSFDADAIRRVLGQDSQAGTRLAKDQLKGQLPAELRQEIAWMWRKEAPKELLAKVGLSHYEST